MEATFLQSIIIALVVGVSSGSIGTFVVLRRMALVGDALSHVALPGIALALAFAVDPFWGVLSFLFAASIIVWWLESKTRLPTDALVGLLFTGSLAVGILTIPNTEILESLFGNFPAFSVPVLILVVVAGIIAAFLSFFFARKFLFSILSPDLSEVQGISSRYQLFFLLIFAFIVALGLKLVGTLLMGALTIIPALIAKNLARSMKSFIILAALLGGVSAVAGVFLADSLHFLPGPMIILFGIGVFLLSLFFVRR